MPDPTTPPAPLDLDELERVARAATPGPWLQPLEDEPRAIVAARSPEVSLLALDIDGMAVVDEEADATLIVAMRNSFESLISELRALRAAVEGQGNRITKVQAATLTDGMRYPDNGALYCRWCSAGPREGHESRCWYLEQVRRVDAAKALADELSKRPAPPEGKP